MTKGEDPSSPKSPNIPKSPKASDTKGGTKENKKDHLIINVKGTPSPPRFKAEEASFLQALSRPILFFFVNLP